MRILLQGGTEHESGTVAAALRRGGLAVADPGDESVDLIVTLGGAPSTVRIGALELDLSRGTTRLGGRALRLTPIERALLAALARSRRPLDRAALLETVWGYGFDPGTNLVAVHIHRLRAKIGGWRIACGPDGYRLAEADSFWDATPSVGSERRRGRAEEAYRRTPEDGARSGMT